MYKRVGLTILKFAVSIGILGYLLWSARTDLIELSKRPKDWGLLLLATGLCLSMVLTTFLRWWLLVRTLNLPFTIRDSLRLGFLGYLFNFVSLGSVGGDLFKAVFIAREQPKRRAEAVATVFIDRLIGLYALFVVSAIAVLVSGQLHSEASEIRFLSRMVLVATGIGSVMFLLILIPGFTGGWVSETLGSIPKIGPTLFKLIGAVRLYRKRLGNVMVAGVMSLGVHSLTTLCMYYIGKGLNCEAPPLIDLFCIVPLAMLTGVLPLPMNALGAIEASMNFLYMHTDPSLNIPDGNGTAVALGYRVCTLIVAIIGYGYYLANRSTVAKVMEEAEHTGDLPDVMHAQDPPDGNSPASENDQHPGKPQNSASSDENDSEGGPANGNASSRIGSDTQAASPK